MANEFGSTALVSGATQLSTEDRLLLGLDDPTDARALTPRQMKEITTARVRHLMTELLHGNLEKVNGWLDAVAQDSPAKALELLMQLAEFSTPKLKAVAVDVRSGDGSVKTLSIQDLERIAAGGGA